MHSFEFLLSWYFITTKGKEIKSPRKRSFPGGWGGMTCWGVGGGETQKQQSTHSVALSLTVQLANDLKDLPSMAAGMAKTA